MQVQSSTVNRTIPLSSLVRGSVGSSRVGLPVSGSQALYARFKHVYGRPSEAGGFSLSKLRSLDNLIDRLVKLKDRDSASLPKREDLTGLSDQGRDALIRELSDKLHRAYLKAETNPFAHPGVSTGLLADFNL
ncbi:hypothetical protein B4O97_02460 [Marispirochaeta aestuarii]|uniref:Uncharacterized protein n=1 Tax=Marispirochaeta aestuarii TaxID=1963862 RepID=A0A1Y1S3D4_9SPIO|nr:hypothetical protein [Marispirochaeta aestuarii]ORC37882.1 hypothetical protein B4O97_02460 [Marispirochaeta aestuarii]